MRLQKQLMQHLTDVQMRKRTDVRNIYYAILPLLFCLLLFSPSSAQHYFQQGVNYEIHVLLNDVAHEISASEKLEYINNSDSTLTEIYFHLWPNGYKNDETALAKELYNEGSFLFLSTDAKDRGYIDSLDFYIDDIKAAWSYDADTIDICKIKLNEPLAPGKKITITTPFHVKIPSGNISRFGHLDQAYFISQWYP